MRIHLKARLLKLKYLASVTSEQLQAIQDRFRASGIPIFVETDQVRTNEAAIVPAAIVSRFNLAPSWYRINVCLDEQFDEAMRLFRDPNYQVRSPVDVEAFERKMDQLGANRPVKLRPSDKTLNWLVGAVILGIALCFAIVALTSSH